MFLLSDIKANRKLELKKRINGRKEKIETGTAFKAVKSATYRVWEKAGGETDKAVPHIDLSPLSEHPPVQSAEVFIIAMNDATSNTHYFKNKPFQAILLFITTLVYSDI